MSEILSGFTAVEEGSGEPTLTVGAHPVRASIALGLNNLDGVKYLEVWRDGQFKCNLAPGQFWDCESNNDGWDGCSVTLNVVRHMEDGRALTNEVKYENSWIGYPYVQNKAQNNLRPDSTCDIPNAYLSEGETKTYAAKNACGQSYFAWRNNDLPLDGRKVLGWMVGTP